MSVPRELLAAGALAAGLMAGCSAPKNRTVGESARPLGRAPETLTAGELAAERVAEESALAPSAGVESAPDGVAVAAPPESTDRADASGKAPTGVASGAPEDVAVSWPKGVDGQVDASTYAIGAVAGRTIPLSDLVAKWIWRSPADVRGILDDLVLSRIITYEAAAIDIQLPPAEVQVAMDRSLDDLKRRAEAAGKPNVDAYIRETLGMEPEIFARYAKEEVLIDLLAPLCIRSWLLRSDRREIRAITVATAQDAEKVQARLDAGEPFELVAKEMSIDPSKEDGGRLPAVVRGNDLMLTRTAFATEVGKVAGPIRDRDEYLFVFVESAPKPLTGAWADFGDEVLKSRDAMDIEDPEFWQWKAEMLLKYDVNMDPFLDLVK